MITAKDIDLLFEDPFYLESTNNISVKVSSKFIEKQLRVTNSKTPEFYCLSKTNL